MRDKFIRDNNDIITARNFIVTGLIAIILCTVSSYLIVNGEVYNLSYAEYLTRILSTRGFNIITVMSFLGIIYCSIFYRDIKEYEFIRYGTLDKYYKKTIIKSIIFAGIFMGIIILNLCVNVLIKASGDFQFSNIVKEIHVNEEFRNLIFMSKELFNYNLMIIITMYFIIFILILITMSNILCVINVLTQNKILVAGIAIIMSLIVMYDGNFGDGKTMTSYLIFNHIDISYSGFGISDNRYVNIIHSFIYLISSNLILFYIGMKFSKTKEIFYYKTKSGELI